MSVSVKFIVMGGGFCRARSRCRPVGDGRADAGTAEHAAAATAASVFSETMATRVRVCVRACVRECVCI